MYHRMYLRRCSMSSISEESETADDLNPEDNPNQPLNSSSKSQPSLSLVHSEVEHCLGDLNAFKKDIRNAYQDLSTLERQACSKNEDPHQDDELDLLLEQLHTLEKRFDQGKFFKQANVPKSKSDVSSSILEQFNELDEALTTLTNTINNVEIEFVDSGNSSSSSGISEPTRIAHQGENDEHFSDSGLSQSTDSISSPLVHPPLSHSSSVLSYETMKTNVTDNPIRLALEKIHQANIKRLFVKIYTDDQSTKNVLIDETMSTQQLIVLLFHKYRVKPTINYAIIEDLPDLHLYRVLEDHQNLINDALVYWPRDTRNRICFREHRHRYLLFEEPRKFFSARDETNGKFAEELLADYVASKKNLLPDDITSILFIKEKNRKVWKKLTCILRQSGIYQIQKSSPLSSTKRDLICVLKFDQNMQLYHANQWVEELRSPTSYGFALKYPHVHKKSSKYIHYLCTNTQTECQRWINGIRLILYGDQLLENYQKMKRVVREGPESLLRQWPERCLLNFVPSIQSSLQHSFSSISMPINRIVFQSMDTSNDLMEIDIPTAKHEFRSLDRQKKTRLSFVRSSSTHSNLHQSKASKFDEKVARTKSTSPSARLQSTTDDQTLKRSKSAKEISSTSSASTRTKSNQKKKDLQANDSLASSSSIIPFIQQCIQVNKADNQQKSAKRSSPTDDSTRISSSIHNHIYDSLQDMSFSSHNIHRKMTHNPLPPTRVTEL